MLNQYTAEIVTDAEGDATVYLGSRIRGKIIALKYSPGSLDAGATLTLSGEDSEVPVLTKANAGGSDVWWYPRAAAAKVADGAASTISEAEVWLMQERLKVVVASGGNAGAGSLMLWVDEPVAG